jgi:peptide/nickel transport system ATP-binding protein
MERCKTDVPESFEISAGHAATCWLYADDPEARAKRADNARTVAGLTAPAPSV